MPYVFCTATGGTDYCEYAPSNEHQASATIIRKVSIKGSANLAPLAGRLITPYGAVTSVNDEELEFLERNESFIRHKKAGFIRVDKANLDPDKVAKEGMQAKDRSAPITPASKEVLGTATPVVPEAPRSRRK